MGFEYAKHTKVDKQVRVYFLCENGQLRQLLTIIGGTPTGWLISAPIPYNEFGLTCALDNLPAEVLQRIGHLHLNGSFEHDLQQKH